MIDKPLTERELMVFNLAQRLWLMEWQRYHKHSGSYPTKNLGIDRTRSAINTSKKFVDEFYRQREEVAPLDEFWSNLPPINKNTRR